MQKKEIIEILALPAKETTEKLNINTRALICLVIANTRWLKYDKPFFDFNMKGLEKKPRYTVNDGWDIYNKFEDSFTYFNDHRLKNCREMKKYWKNRLSFNGFIYGLKDSGLINDFVKKEAIKIGYDYTKDDWRKFLSD